MGNIFGTTIYCDFCDKYADHTTDQHLCGICKAIGQHSALDHKGCSFCLNSHQTQDHICTKCNEKGHIAESHICVVCDGFHRADVHPCDVCDVAGCKVKQHDECTVCTGKKRFTHSIEEHVKHIDISTLDYTQVKNTYKRCEDCDQIVIVDCDNRCIICTKIVPDFVKCPRSECKYKMDNFMVSYCPLCGSNILCTKCLKQVTENAMYESDDEHANC